MPFRRFRPEVEILLTEAGWSSTRKINTRELLAEAECRGFAATERVGEIMEQFGELTIHSPRSDQLTFVPDLLGEYDDWGAEVISIIQAEFFPIASWGPLSIIIDVNDRVFGNMMEYVEYIGVSFEDAIEYMVVRDRRPNVFCNGPV